MAKMSISEMKRIGELMARFNESGLPEDFGQFLNDEVVPTYIFYNGKAKTGYCTTCRSEFKVSGLKHKKETVCPSCGRKAIARSEGMKREKDEVYWSQMFQPDGENVLSRSFRHILNLSDYRNPQIETSELFRTLYIDGESIDFMYVFDQKCLRENWVYYSDRYFYNYMYPKTSEYYLPHLTTVYRGSDFQSLVVNSPALKYAPIRELLNIKEWLKDGKVYGFGIDAALNFHHRFPYAEKLLKVGLDSLVKCLMADTNYGKYFDHTQSELKKILGLDKKRYEILRSVDNPCIDDLRLLQDFKPEPDEFYWLKTKNLYRSYNKTASAIQKALSYASIAKVRKYVDGGADCMLWDDLLGWQEKLGIDLHDEYYLFPKNLRKMHDDTYLGYLKQTDPARYEQKMKEDALIAEANKKRAEYAPFHLHYCGLFIRPAKDTEELRKEGNALHHCVETYASKYAEGKTTILVIRQEDKPDTPYYTLEWNGKVIQVRGSHNCAPNEKVAEFVKQFNKANDEEYANTKKAKRLAKAAA